MNRTARTLWGLATVAAATVVGITTQEPGFIIITFVGGLLLPRVLGFGGSRWRAWGPGAYAGYGARRRFEERMDAWHRRAHGEAAPQTPAVSGSTQI
jgi:hypothetical protein